MPADLKSSEFIIREYRDTDLTGVLELWEKHSGWGRPGEEEYKRWLRTPFGDCTGIVAETSDHNIIGHFINTPCEVVVNGISGKALKMSAPVIHRDHRSTVMMRNDSVVLQMFIQAYPLMKEKGFDWFYSFPAHAWIRLLESVHHFGLNPWKVVTLPCFEIDETVTAANRYKLVPLDHFTEPVQNIWEHFRGKNDDMSFFARNREWLNYKWGSELKVGVYSLAGSLTGYTVIKRSTGLILDLILLEPDDLPGFMKDLVNFYKAQPFDTNNGMKPGLKFMDNAFFQKYIKDLKIRPVDYKFAFGISCMKEEGRTETLNMSNWYIFPND